MDGLSEVKVSVVVPNYNYDRFLAKRLRSILEQTYADFEVIILDDASTDDSLEVITYFRLDQRITKVIVNKENSGSPFKQWEKGIAMARGKYIWIAESDDAAEPEFLSECMSVLDKDPEIALVKTMSTLIDAKGNPSPIKPFDDYGEDGSAYIYDGNSYIETRMLDKNSFYNASMIVFRKDAFESLADKDYKKMSFAGDWLLWGKMMAGRKVAEIHERLSMFRLHGRSTTDKRRDNPDKARAEDEFVKWSLVKEAGLNSPRVLSKLEYRLGKLLRDPSYDGVLEQINKLSPQMREELEAFKPGAGKQWLSKHFYSALPSQKLVPLSQYKLNKGNTDKKS